MDDDTLRQYEIAVGEQWRNEFALNMVVRKTGGNVVDRWESVVGLPKRSILIAGASGAGKTEAAKHLVHQILFDRDALILVYDHKRDYQDLFDRLGIKYIRISMADSTHIWNCFGEFDEVRDIDEFARALYPELGGHENDFFDDMARQVFAACLKMMIRNNDGFEGLSNATIRDYFRSHGAGAIYTDLSEFADLQAAASAIDFEASSRQAQGVYASVQRVVNKVFIGDFGAAPVSNHGFSLREHVQDPQGVPIVLDFPTAAGQTTKPIFRFLIDHAAMLALKHSDDQSYFVLDEFAQIPQLRRFDELVNIGRGENVTTLVTLQSMQQLYSNYGRQTGESILSGLVSMILLRPNDDATVEFYRSAIGSEFTEYAVNSPRETRAIEEHEFSKGAIRRWNPGVGVIVNQSGWRHGYIPQMTESQRKMYAHIG
jgi:hypothetical protein